MMERVIERELLDELPADDPRAIHSRGDLRKVNAWMGHAGVMAGILSNAFQHRPPLSIVELGAGDGTFLLRLAERLGPAWKPSRVVLVDQQRLLDERTRAAFGARQWNVRSMSMNVFDWIEAEDESSELILANLFLHHFVDADLRRLFERVAQRTGFFLACEPRRSPFALRATYLLWLIGCNDLTRHDGRLSVRAGFSGSELSRLWPADRRWRLQERAAGWVSHCFAAGPAAGQTGLVSSIRQEGPPV
jgi:ubiquinone/menaquinone biosynthesis C-methylase UbiE